jgi:hypothetical protein
MTVRLVQPQPTRPKVIIEGVSKRFMSSRAIVCRWIVCRCIHV